MADKPGHGNTGAAHEAGSHAAHGHAHSHGSRLDGLAQTATAGEHGHSHEGSAGDHSDRPSVWGLLLSLGIWHGHSHAGPSTDAAMESSARGIWAVKISLAMLAATAAFQIIIVIVSGSVALFADTIHNFTDALTSLPLWLAFALSRRPASRRFTHGYGRAEDIAGVIIVALILVSAGVAGYESYRKILDPVAPENIGWVIVAGLAGFVGNEAVAVLRTRVGNQIGSAALVADGKHARVDGLTSLAVLGGAAGVLLGAPIADPIVGAAITVAILFIAKDAALMIGHRLMDAVDPALVAQLEAAAAATIGQNGAYGIDDVRLRWVGHKLQAELNLTVDGDLPTRESHHMAEELRHALFHALPGLSTVTVHVDPWSSDGHNHHGLTEHHAAEAGAGREQPGARAQ
jgi:cation diffusion facilitator family transporter